MKAYKNIIFVFVIGFALVAQLTNPTLVHADGEPPTPPTEPATEVAPTEVPVATEPPTLPEGSATEIPTELPVATEAAPTEFPIATEAPADSEIIPAGVPATVAPVEPIAADESTLLEVIQEFPAETGVVVLDESGDSVPLATQAAADIIMESDPIWCPGTSIPVSFAGCTPSYTTLDDLLINEGFNIDANPGDGTIWMTAGTISDASAIWIDGSTYTNWANHALTLQGGWTGTAAGTISGTSDFSVPISIINWSNNVVVNNITINGTGTETGLTVATTGNVDIKDSDFNQNFIGASITPNGNVKVNGSVFSKNVYDGLRVFTSNGLINNIELNNSTFSYNNRNYTDGYGVWLYTDPSDIATAVGNTFFNNAYGLVAYTANINYDVLLTNTFNFNCYDISTWSISQDGNYCGPPLTPPDDTPTYTSNIPPIRNRASGAAFSLNCAGVDGFAVNLPNGDLVNIYCPVRGVAQIDRVDNTTLPAELPIGYSYASAFSLDIVQNEKPITVITEGGYITASFVAQPLQPGNTYSILYWDNGNWLPLKNFMLDENGQPVVFELNPGFPNDTRKILKGVNVVTNRGLSRVEISTNFPGTFVLVQQ